jgi:hypothetical protein
MPSQLPQTIHSQSFVTTSNPEGWGTRLSTSEVIGGLNVGYGPGYRSNPGREPRAPGQVSAEAMSMLYLRWSVSMNVGSTERR